MFLGVIFAASLGIKILGWVGIVLLVVLGFAGTMCLFESSRSMLGFFGAWFISDALWEGIGNVIGAILSAISD